MPYQPSLLSTPGTLPMRSGGIVQLAESFSPRGMTGKMNGANFVPL
jgi:hypothetical protein